MSVSGVFFGLLTQGSQNLRKNAWLGKLMCDQSIAKMNLGAESVSVIANNLSLCVGKQKKFLMEQNRSFANTLITGLSNWKDALEKLKKIATAGADSTLTDLERKLNAHDAYNMIQKLKKVTTGTNFNDIEALAGSLRVVRESDRSPEGIKIDSGTVTKISKQSFLVETNNNPHQVDRIIDVGGAYQSFASRKRMMMKIGDPLQIEVNSKKYYMYTPAIDVPEEKNFAHYVTPEILVEGLMNGEGINLEVRSSELASDGSKIKVGYITISGDEAREFVQKEMAKRGFTAGVLRFYENNKPYSYSGADMSARSLDDPILFTHAATGNSEIINSKFDYKLILHSDQDIRIQGSQTPKEYLLDILNDFPERALLRSNTGFTVERKYTLGGVATDMSKFKQVLREKVFTTDIFGDSLDDFFQGLNFALLSSTYKSFIDETLQIPGVKAEMGYDNLVIEIKDPNGVVKTPQEVADYIMNRHTSDGNYHYRNEIFLNISGEGDVPFENYGLLWLTLNNGKTICFHRQDMSVDDYSDSIKKGALQAASSASGKALVNVVDKGNCFAWQETESYRSLKYDFKNSLGFQTEMAQKNQILTYFNPSGGGDLNYDALLAAQREALKDLINAAADGKIKNAVGNVADGIKFVSKTGAAVSFAAIDGLTAMPGVLSAIPLADFQVIAKAAISKPGFKYTGYDFFTQVLLNGINFADVSADPSLGAYQRVLDGLYGAGAGAEFAAYMNDTTVDGKKTHYPDQSSLLGFLDKWQSDNPNVGLQEIHSKFSILHLMRHEDVAKLNIEIIGGSNTEVSGLAFLKWLGENQQDKATAEKLKLEIPANSGATTSTVNIVETKSEISEGAAELLFGVTNPQLSDSGLFSVDVVSVEKGVEKTIKLTGRINPATKIISLNSIQNSIGLNIDASLWELPESVDLNNVNPSDIIHLRKAFKINMHVNGLSAPLALVAKGAADDFKPLGNLIAHDFFQSRYYDQAFISMDYKIDKKNYEGRFTFSDGFKEFYLDLKTYKKYGLIKIPGTDITLNMQGFDPSKEIDPFVFKVGDEDLGVYATAFDFSIGSLTYRATGLDKLDFGTMEGCKRAMVNLLSIERQFLSGLGKAAALFSIISMNHAANNKTIEAQLETIRSIEEGYLNPLKLASAINDLNSQIQAVSNITGNILRKEGDKWSVFRGMLVQA